MLEEIVKENVPFVGILISNGGFDEKGRVVLQKPLLDILKRRQKVEEKYQIQLFYRLHTNEVPRYLELTDYFLGIKHLLTNFMYYHPLNLDEKSHILINPSNLQKVNIENHDPIIFIGSKDKILIYKAEDYKNRKILSLNSLWNVLVRAYERFAPPKIT